MIKKLTQIWNILFVSKVVIIPPKNVFEVKIVNDETNSLSESIGLTEERKAELTRLTATSMIMTKKISDAINVASKQCKHANELFFVSFIIGDSLSKNKDPLRDLLQGFLESRKDQDDD